MRNFPKTVTIIVLMLIQLILAIFIRITGIGTERNGFAFFILFTYVFLIPTVLGVLWVVALPYAAFVGTIGYVKNDEKKIQLSSKIISGVFTLTLGILLGGIPSYMIIEPVANGGF